MPKSRRRAREIARRQKPQPARLARAPREVKLVLPPGMDKMSDTLLDFATPFMALLDGARDHARMRDAISAASVVWNLAAELRANPVVGPATDALDNVIENVADALGVDEDRVEEAVMEMLRVRAGRYGADPRITVETTVWSEEDEIRVNVAWAV